MSIGPRTQDERVAQWVKMANELTSDSKLATLARQAIPLLADMLRNEWASKTRLIQASIEASEGINDIIEELKSKR